MSMLWARLRDARYALPGQIERWTDGPDSRATARLAARLGKAGLATTLGYFQRNSDGPEVILAQNLAAAAALGGHDIHLSAYLSVKAPPLGFDPARVEAIAEAARAAGTTILLDAHAPRDAEATLALVEHLLPAFPGTGCAIPARWERSADDVERLRDTSARIRLVKGEWPDPVDDGDIEERYVVLARLLAGRRAPVAVATHRPELARAALRVLQSSGTPCELEQLRGLPRRASSAVAAELGVPVRLYLPFGPGWWPYAVDKALARHYLPGWILRDLVGPKGNSATA